MKNGITIEMAQNSLCVAIECELKILRGGQTYRYEGNISERPSLEEVRKSIIFWQGQVTNFSREPIESVKPNKK